MISVYAFISLKLLRPSVRKDRRSNKRGMCKLVNFFGFFPPPQQLQSAAKKQNKGRLLSFFFLYFYSQDMEWFTSIFGIH